MCLLAAFCFLLLVPLTETVGRGAAGWCGPGVGYPQLDRGRTDILDTTTDTVRYIRTAVWWCLVRLLSAEYHRHVQPRSAERGG